MGLKVAEPQLFDVPERRTRSRQRSGASKRRRLRFAVTEVPAAVPMFQPLVDRGGDLVPALPPARRSVWTQLRTAAEAARGPWGSPLSGAVSAAVELTWPGRTWPASVGKGARSSAAVGRTVGEILVAAGAVEEIDSSTIVVRIHTGTTRRIEVTVAEK